MSKKNTRYKYYQPNKKDLKDNYGDCVIRAICKATGKTWLEVFDELIPYAREIQAHPNDKTVYEKYLADLGFTWTGLGAVKGKKRLTPDTFYKEYPTGTYILRLSGHLVTVENGYYFDTWDSGEKCVYGYWSKGGKS